MHESQIIIRARWLISQKAIKCYLQFQRQVELITQTISLTSCEISGIFLEENNVILKLLLCWITGICVCITSVGTSVLQKTKAEYSFQIHIFYLTNDDLLSAPLLYAQIVRVQDSWVLKESFISKGSSYIWSFGSQNTCKDTIN